MANEKQILIVEDERPLALALSTKLTREGFAVSVATNGSEGITQIKEKKFDTVILDLVMPDMDGFEFLTQLKAQEVSTPVIVLSNLSQESDEKKALELGAQVYLIKSDTPLTSVVAKVQELIK